MINFENKALQGAFCQNFMIFEKYILTLPTKLGLIFDTNIHHAYIQFSSQ